jgi:hypothetical protein
MSHGVAAIEPYLAAPTEENIIDLMSVVAL